MSALLFSAKLDLPVGERYSLPGMMMVEERKLQVPPDENVMRLFLSDKLAWVYAHLISIGNFAHLPGKAGSSTSGGLSRSTPPATPEKAAASASKPVRKSSG